MVHVKARFHLESITDVALRFWGRNLEKATSLSDCHFAEARFVHIRRNTFQEPSQQTKNKPTWLCRNVISSFMSQAQTLGEQRIWGRVEGGGSAKKGQEGAQSGWKGLRSRCWAWTF